jgi:ribosome-associated heat shock protein Hsp15
VEVNGCEAKAHRLVVVGDRLEVRFGDWTRILIVRELRDRPVPKAQAPGLYQDLSAPRPRLDPLERILQSPERRDRGAGRPTKKDRRRIERLKGKS